MDKFIDLVKKGEKLTKEGQSKKALGFWEKAEKRASKIGKFAVADVLWNVLFQQGLILSRLGKHSKAIVKMESALEFGDQTFTKEKFNTRYLILIFLGLSYIQSNTDIDRGINCLLESADYFTSLVSHFPEDITEDQKSFLSYEFDIRNKVRSLLQQDDERFIPNIERLMYLSEKIGDPLFNIIATDQFESIYHVLKSGSWETVSSTARGSDSTGSNEKEIMRDVYKQDIGNLETVIRSLHSKNAPERYRAFLALKRSVDESMDLFGEEKTLEQLLVYNKGYTENDSLFDLMRALVYTKNNPENSLAITRKILDTNPVDELAWSIRTETYWSINDFQSAVNELDSALDSNTDVPFLRNLLYQSFYLLTDGDHSDYISESPRKIKNLFLQPDSLFHFDTGSLCKKCCSKDDNRILFIPEIASIMEKKGIESIDELSKTLELVINPFSKLIAAKIPITNGGTCIHFSLDGSCRLGDVKPVSCASYPIKKEIIIGDSSGEEKQVLIPVMHPDCSRSTLISPVVSVDDIIRYNDLAHRWCILEDYKDFEVDFIVEVQSISRKIERIKPEMRQYVNLDTYIASRIRYLLFPVKSCRILEERREEKSDTVATNKRMMFKKLYQWFLTELQDFHDAVTLLLEVSNNLERDKFYRKYKDAIIPVITNNVSGDILFSTTSESQMMKIDTLVPGNPIYIDMNPNTGEGNFVKFLLEIKSIEGSHIYGLWLPKKNDQSYLLTKKDLRKIGSFSVGISIHPKEVLENSLEALQRRIR